MVRKILGGLLKNKSALVGVIICTLIIVMAIAGPLLAKDPYRQEAKTLLRPSLSHPMGTDNLGRDVLSRLLIGARYSLMVGFFAVLLASILGLLAGSAAGFFGGVADSVIMRLADVFLAFPYVLGAIALMVFLGPSLINVPIAIAVFTWASFARIYRSSVLDIKGKEYVTAARLSGAGSVRVMFGHIMPNAAAPLIVFGTTEVAYAILGESVLSFIGLGAPVQFPSWGRMLADSLNYSSTSPWLIFFPGLFLVLTVLSFILIGDGLRDVLDPKTVD